jgi:hypothetical protein
MESLEKKDRRGFLRSGLAAMIGISIANSGLYSQEPIKPDQKFEEAYHQYKGLLEKKKKFDPNHEKEFRASLESVSNQKTRLENIQHELEIETNGEAYLKKHLSEDEQRIIYEMWQIPEVGIQAYLSSNVFRNRKIDYKLLDYADRIRAYLWFKKMGEKDIENAKKEIEKCKKEEEEKKKKKAEEKLGQTSSFMIDLIEGFLRSSVGRCK